MNRFFLKRATNPDNSAQQHGVTLIELLLSMGIGVFLLAGLAMIFISDKISFATQNNLAQMENNQLMAINILTNVIQSAGYYPSSSTPTSTNLPVESTYSLTIKNGSSSSSSLAVSYGTAGQAVFGGSINGSDSISVRSIGAINCTGNTSGDLVSSTFTVDSYNNLQCTTWDITTPANNTATQTLVGPGYPATGTVTNAMITGVQSMQVLYGVNPASDSATQYVTAANVTNWSGVMSVRVTLNFCNPLYSKQPACQLNTTDNQGQPGTLAFTRVIGLMGHL